MYLIPFLHQTTTILTFLNTYASCILFHFYIKPQPCLRQCDEYASCILFHFYIKPQLLQPNTFRPIGCILFHFYIKPQLMAAANLIDFVVSYSISTSNHNCFSIFMDLSRVVSYSISTSNHNHASCGWATRRLYLIPFLHQTTTVS